MIVQNRLRPGLPRKTHKHPQAALSRFFAVRRRPIWDKWKGSPPTSLGDASGSYEDPAIADLSRLKVFYPLVRLGRPGPSTDDGRSVLPCHDIITVPRSWLTKRTSLCTAEQPQEIYFRRMTCWTVFKGERFRDCFCENFGVGSLWLRNLSHRVCAVCPFSDETIRHSDDLCAMAENMSGFPLKEDCH